MSLKALIVLATLTLLLTAASSCTKPTKTYSPEEVLSLILESAIIQGPPETDENSSNEYFQHTRGWIEFLNLISSSLQYVIEYIQSNNVPVESIKGSYKWEFEDAALTKTLVSTYQDTITYEYSSVGLSGDVFSITGWVLSSNKNSYLHKNGSIISRNEQDHDK